MCGAADLNPATVQACSHSPAGGGVELFDRGHLQPALAGSGDDRVSERVLTGMLGRGGEREQLVGGEVRPAHRPDVRQGRGPLGEGSGFVECDGGDRTELLHHDGGFDQHAVAAGVGHRRQ